MQLVLNEFGVFLGKKGERLVVKRRDQPALEFPADQVKEILVATRGASVSADAVELAVGQGTAITFLHRSGEPYARVETPRVLRRAALRREQLAAGLDERGFRIAKGIIEGKLRNQGANLKYFAKSRRDTAGGVHEDLHGLADCIRGILNSVQEMVFDGTTRWQGRLMALEGQAARKYWQGLGAVLPEEMGFSGRVRQGAADMVNVCLNYGYGILYARGWSAAVLVSLDPYAGFLHSDRDGQATLVFDLVEQFRPILVDRPLVARLTKQWRPAVDEDGMLSRESRAVVAQCVLSRFESRASFRGKCVRMESIVTAQAYEMVNAVQGAGRYRPYVATW